jgi:hypothetical protein
MRWIFTIRPKPIATTVMAMSNVRRLKRRGSQGIAASDAVRSARVQNGT